MQETGDVDGIPGSGRFSGGGHGNHSSILAWRIAWAGYSPYGCKESDTAKVT